MISIICLIIIVVLICMIVYTSISSFSNSNSKPITAVAVFDNSASPGLSGVVHLTEISPELTRISGYISGLSPGEHGFHIHKDGDLTEGCKSMCSHYNPFKLDHGGPDSSIRHVGDLGNIVANQSGTAQFVILDKMIKLRPPHSVIGRSFVIHKNRDDLGLGTGAARDESLKTGNAGARLGCAIIGISSKESLN
jgi:Cu-Zn family superoxide dismutase